MSVYSSSSNNNNNSNGNKSPLSYTNIYEVTSKDENEHSPAYSNTSRGEESQKSLSEEYASSEHSPTQKRRYQPSLSSSLNSVQTNDGIFEPWPNDNERDAKVKNNNFNVEESTRERKNIYNEPPPRNMPHCLINPDRTMDNGSSRSFILSQLYNRPSSREKKDFFENPSHYYGAERFEPYNGLPKQRFSPLFLPDDRASFSAPNNCNNLEIRVMSRSLERMEHDLGKDYVQLFSERYSSNRSLERLYCKWVSLKSSMEELSREGNPHFCR